MKATVQFAAILSLLVVSGWASAGGEKQIVVNLDKQKLTATEGGKAKFEFDCVTGDKDHPTKPGEFTVYKKKKEYTSKKYNVDMPYSLFFSKDGKAIHAGLCCVAAESFAKAVLDDLGADLLGSHGCVRLSKDDAKALFDWADTGTKVQVVEK